MTPGSKHRQAWRTSTFLVVSWVAAACLASDGQDRDVIVDVAVADQGRHERGAGGLRQSVWAICGDGVSEDRAHSREARVDVAVVVVDKAIGEQAEKAARLKGERACRARSSEVDPEREPVGLLEQSLVAGGRD